LLADSRPDVQRPAESEPQPEQREPGAEAEQMTAPASGLDAEPVIADEVQPTRPT